MKTITVTNAKLATETGDNADLHLSKFEINGPEEMDASDGYHTFTELYDHRITLFITLCKAVSSLEARESRGVEVWRSKLHSDGSAFEGWFILGIFKEKGKQITYHLPLSRWEETEGAETLEKAPEWDGHSAADVLERLKKL